MQLRTYPNIKLSVMTLNRSEAAQSHLVDTKRFTHVTSQPVDSKTAKGRKRKSPYQQGTHHN